MKTLRAWTMRLAGLFGKARREKEMAEELESHLAMHIADNLRAGMTPVQARREAMLKLGGLESVKEAYRDRSTAPFLEHLGMDVRFTFRQLRKNPGFATTAVVVLALGMCASIAIFAFVDAALIKPLPYPDPLRIAAVTETAPGFARANLSYPDYQDWKRLNTVFASLDRLHRGWLPGRYAFGRRADAGWTCQLRILSHATHKPGLGPGLFSERRSARRSARRDAELRHLAAAVRRERQHLRPARQVER